VNRLVRADVHILKIFLNRARACPMFFGQREKQVAVHHVVALVEFDMQKMRVRFLLTREAIKERMQELEHPQEFKRG
jgi:hypothetical protein